MFYYLLQDITSTAYWTGSAWQGTQPGVLPTATWFTSSATITGVNFTGRSGHSILLVPMPQDNSGTTQTSFVVGYASNTYTVDLTAPQSFLTNPSSSFSDSLPFITGTMSDNASAIPTVNIQISSPSANPNSYWNGASWQGSAVTVPATNVYTSSWSYTVPAALKWIDGQTFNIQTQATDAVGNQETLGANGNQSFLYVITLPSSTIQVPVANNFYNSFTVISGTAAVSTAGDQINNIQLGIQDVDTQDWWLGGPAGEIRGPFRPGRNVI